MKTFTVVQEIGYMQAFLVEHSLTQEERHFLHQITGHRFCIQPELAQRWGLVEVLALPSWAREQKKRQPMLKPKGRRLAILGEYKWQSIATAPKNATWVEVRMRNGVIRMVHWAEDLSGEDQPCFSGWFVDNGVPGRFDGIDEPEFWRPLL